MYEAFYKLKLKPFELVPNPAFLYLSKTHKKAINYLQYGIQEGMGFILLTGEVGSGKTTLISDLTRQLAHNVTIARIFNTNVSSEQLFAMINDDFGLDVKGKDKIMLLKDLNAFLIEEHTRRRNTVLIIDEAQNLKSNLLEEIRMLSNLETNTSKLLQILLVGQPELRDILSAPNMRQLRQRIGISCSIEPLDKDDTLNYIQHRLEVAGNKNAVTFVNGSIEAIHKYCKGIPRLINTLCDFLLLAAFNEETTKVDSTMVNEVANDLDFETLYWGGKSTAPKTSVDHTALLSALGIEEHKQ